MPRAIAWIVFAVAAASLPACAAEPPRTGIAPPTRIPNVELASGPPGVAVTAASVPRAVRRAVVADAARRFKVNESAVVITQVEKVTWSDASLGCPQPGRMYTQALVEGYRVVAKAGVVELTYHTDSQGRTVSCATQRVANPPVMDTEPRPYQPAQNPPEK